MAVPSEDDKRSQKIIEDVKNANNWARLGTYGGSLMENVIQAICRDLLVHAMLTIDEEGYPIVLHVHDEIIIESQENVASYKLMIMQDIMRTPPEWAAGFPLWADCKIMARYGK
jgi:DNA polymerase